MRVEVYYNLHKKTFSVRHKGKVIEHTDRIVLQDVTFAVQPAGRAKVVREGKKNVHAFVRGTIGERPIDWNTIDDWADVTYNPYYYSSFVDDETKEPVHSAKVVKLLKPESAAPQITAFY
jgi:hypothetical protein